jgi:exoribonuclease R
VFSAPASECLHVLLQVYIDGMQNRNRAMDGDTVIVRLIANKGQRSSEASPEDGANAGIVLRIVAAKERKLVVGHLEIYRGGRPAAQALFVPHDTRLTPMLIPAATCPSSLLSNNGVVGDLYCAQLLGWPAGSPLPTGRLDR